MQMAKAERRAMGEDVVETTPMFPHTARRLLSLRVSLSGFTINPVARSPSLQGSGSLVSGAPASAVHVFELSAVPGVYSSYLWKNVAFIVWFAPATLESLAVFETGIKSLTERHPEGLSSVHIMVPGGKSLPTAEARAELARLMREYATLSSHVAVVIPGSGFWASALRGVVTALAMLSPRDKKPHICGTLPEVALWLPDPHRARTGVRVEPEQLLAALRYVERDASAIAA
jgi:hypothetical protein